MMILGRTLATNTPPTKETNMEKSYQNNIKKLRTELHLTQKQLADEINVSRDCIVQWENNSDRLPALDKLILLADKYNVTIDYLIGRSDCTSVENEYIQQVTGLSDSAINALRDFKKSDSAGIKHVIDSVKHDKQPTHPLYALEIINFFLTSKHFKKFLSHFRNLSSDTYNVPIVIDGKNYKILSSNQNDTGNFLYFGCNPNNPADNISVQIDEDFRKEISRKLLYNSLNDISADYQKSQEDFKQEIIKSFRKKKSHK